MYFIHYAFDIHRIGETLWRGNGTIDVTSVIMIICYKKWSFTLMSDEKWSLGNLHFSNGRWFPGYIYICYVYLHIYKIYTQRNIHYVSTFFGCGFWFILSETTSKIRLGSPTEFGPSHHFHCLLWTWENLSIINLRTPTRLPRYPVPGWRSFLDGHFVMIFLGRFFLLLLTYETGNSQGKEKNLSFFGGWGDAGWDVFRQVFFWKEKNHLEWVGIFSFLPQLGSFAGSRNTSGRTGSWTLSNMWNKKSNQNLTQIPTTRGSTNSFAGWNEDVFTIQKKWWLFFQPAFGIC